MKKIFFFNILLLSIIFIITSCINFNPDGKVTISFSGAYLSNKFDESMYTHVQLSLKKSGNTEIYKEFAKNDTLEFAAVPTGIYTITATAIDKTDTGNIKKRFKGTLNSFEVKSQNNNPVIDTVFFNGHLNIIINNQMGGTKIYALLSSAAQLSQDFEITGSGIVKDIYPSVWNLVIYYKDNNGKNVNIFSQTLPELSPDETLSFALNIDPTGNVYFSYLNTSFISGVKNLKSELLNNKVTLTWTYDDNGALFKVYRKKSTDFMWSFLSDTTSLLYEDYSLTENGDYDYGVNTVINSKESGIIKTNIYASLSNNVDLSGTVYSGNYLLVSNESLSETIQSYTGTLPEIRIKELLKSETVLSPDDSDNRIDIIIKPPEKQIHQFLNYSSRAGYSLGDIKTFYTANFDANKYEQLNATLQYSGSYCDIWAVNTADITRTKAQTLGEEFDNNIYSLITNNFYTPSDVNNDGKVAVLCFDIKDGFSGSGGYIAGYFDPSDLMNYSTSNKMEVFYIDTYPTMKSIINTIDVSKAYSTLAHEFQHMVNYNRNVIVENGVDMPVWLNEGLSMAAEHIYEGVQSRRINYFNNSDYIRNGHSLLRWDDYGDTLSNYSLSYLFLQYLKIQLGQGNSIFREIIESPLNDYRIIENEIHTYISSSISFTDFMSDFRIALLLKETTGLYGFKGDPSFSDVNPKIYTGTGTYIYGGGALYKSIYSSFSDPGNKSPGIVYAGITK